MFKVLTVFFHLEILHILISLQKQS